MKILLLTDWAYPCDEPFLNQVYAERLSNMGHELVWVMAPDDGQSDIQKRTWNGHPVYVLREQDYNPIRVFAKHFSTGLGDHPVVDISSEHPDIDFVQVRNDLAMGLLGTHLKQTRELPFVHRISHLKAETTAMMASEGLIDSRMSEYAKGKLGKRLRRYICERSDLVLSISKAMKSYLEDEGWNTPIVPLPMGADTRISPKPIDSAPFEEEYGLTDKEFVLYMGTMSPIRKLEFLFDVLAELRKRRDVNLVFVGGRYEKNRDRLRRYAEESTVTESVTFTGWISEANVKRAIKAADVGVSPLPPNYILRTNTPTKLLEYLNLCTPAVATDTPDQRYLLEQSNGGEIAEYDPHSFADSIHTVLKSNPVERGRRGREFIKEERSYDKLTEEVVATYREHGII